MLTDNSITGSKIADDTITRNHIRDSEIGFNKLTDEAKSSIREDVEARLTLGGIKDSENQTSNEAVHFTNTLRSKLNDTKIFNNYESITGNTEDIVLVNRGAGYDICLNPKLRSDLESKADSTDKRVTELKNDYETSKNEMDKKVDTLKTKTIIASLNDSFKTFDDETLTFIKQGSFVNLIGTIQTTTDVHVGSVICDVPVIKDDSLIPLNSVESKLILNGAFVHGFGFVTLKLDVSNKVLKINEVSIDGDAIIPRGVNLKCKFDI